MSAVTKAVEVVKESNGTGITSVNGMHRELMRLQNSHQTDRSNQYTAQDGENFIASESDRQFLLIKYVIVSFSLPHALAQNHTY